MESSPGRGGFGRHQPGHLSAVSNSSSRRGDAAQSADRLGSSLKPRHITMISIAGVIGAGLFVGSANDDREGRSGRPHLLCDGGHSRGAGHADVGGDGDRRPRHRLVLRLRRPRARAVGRLLRRLVVLVVLGARHPGGGDGGGRDPHRSDRWGPMDLGIGRDDRTHGHQPRQRRQLRRVRVLVRAQSRSSPSWRSSSSESSPSAG